MLLLAAAWPLHIHSLEKHIYDIINGLLWGQIAAYIFIPYVMFVLYAFGKIFSCFSFWYTILFHYGLWNTQVPIPSTMTWEVYKTWTQERILWFEVIWNSLQPKSNKHASDSKLIPNNQREIHRRVWWFYFSKEKFLFLLWQINVIICSEVLRVCRVFSTFWFCFILIFLLNNLSLPFVFLFAFCVRSVCLPALSRGSTFLSYQTDFRLFIGHIWHFLLTFCLTGSVFDIIRRYTNGAKKRAKLLKNLIPSLLT
jgi:hypothetical protein